MNSKNERPLKFEELDNHFRDRDPIEAKPIKIERRFHVQAEGEPKFKGRFERVHRGEGESSWELIVELEGVRVGGRALPPPLKGKPCKCEKRTIGDSEIEQLQGFAPKHLGFSAKPRELVKTFNRIRATVPEPRIPTTIFGTDNRRAFQDTHYPWST